MEFLTRVLYPHWYIGDLLTLLARGPEFEPGYGAMMISREEKMTICICTFSESIASFIIYLRPSVAAPGKLRPSTIAVKIHHTLLPSMHVHER